MLRFNAYKFEVLRKQQRLTQEDIAVSGDISIRTISRIVSAVKKGDDAIDNLDLRLSTIRAIAGALGVSAIALLEDTPDIPTPDSPPTA